MPVFDLSIDMDFFCREDPAWDWGHNETDSIFTSWIWPLRYGDRLLHDECDPRVHCDFTPDLLTWKLYKRGIDFAEHASKRQVGYAASHKHAFDFFTRFDPPDMLVNLDAHHDCWPYKSGDPHCGNWIPALQQAWGPKTQILQQYPKWKDPDLDGPVHTLHEDVPEQYKPSKKGNYNPVAPGKWADNKWPKNMQLRHVFLCLSPVWVPPHFDRDFIRLVGEFGELSESDLIELAPIPDRTTVTMTRDEAYEYYQQHQTLLRDFSKQAGVLVQFI